MPNNLSRDIAVYQTNASQYSKIDLASRPDKYVLLSLPLHRLSRDETESMQATMHQLVWQSTAIVEGSSRASYCTDSLRRDHTPRTIHELAAIHELRQFVEAQSVLS